MKDYKTIFANSRL